MLTWQDSFILIGGNGYVRGVQTFDQVEQKWSDLVSETPFNIWYPGNFSLLPVEHRSYNRDFKISSTILIPPLEIILKFFVKLVLPSKRPFNLTGYGMLDIVNLDQLTGAHHTHTYLITTE